MQELLRSWMLILGFMLFAVGCVLVRSDDFTYRDKGPIAASNIRLDGYYYMVNRDTSNTFRGVTILPIILWRDRTAFHSSLGYGKTIKSKKTGNTIWGSLKEAKIKFEKIISKELYRKKGGDGLHDWGKFRVRGDSISIQVMSLSPVFSYVISQAVSEEYNGVILNDTTFVLGERIVHSGPFEGVYKLNEKYHFSPLEEGEKPPSDNWTQTHSELQ